MRGGKKTRTVPWLQPPSLHFCIPSSLFAYPIIYTFILLYSGYGKERLFSLNTFVRSQKHVHRLLPFPFFYFISAAIPFVFIFFWGLFWFPMTGRLFLSFSSPSGTDSMGWGRGRSGGGGGEHFVRNSFLPLSPLSHPPPPHPLYSTVCPKKMKKKAK